MLSVSPIKFNYPEHIFLQPFVYSYFDEVTLIMPWVITNIRISVSNILLESRFLFRLFFAFSDIINTGTAQTFQRLWFTCFRSKCGGVWSNRFRNLVDARKFVFHLSSSGVNPTNCSSTMQPGVSKTSAADAWLGRHIKTKHPVTYFFQKKKSSCDEALLHIFIFVLRKKWNNFEAWLYYERRYEKIRWINYSDLYVSFIWWWELRNAFLKETNQNKSLASSARNASWHYRLDAVL